MCAPCIKRRRSPQKLPQFREPIGNSIILCRALHELFPSWSLADGQALRSWILSMPASIRGRLDLLPEEYLRQFCTAPPPLPSVASAVAEAVTAALSPAAPTGAEAAAAARPPTPPGAVSAAQPGCASCTQPAPVYSGFAVWGASVASYGARGAGTCVPAVAWPGWAGPGAAASGPAPLPVPMEQDEEDLLLEEEVTSTRL